MAKIIATREAQGALTEQESQLLTEAEQRVYISELHGSPLIRFHFQPNGVKVKYLFLGFPDHVLKQLRRDQYLYFLQWSQRWDSNDKFADNVAFFDGDDTYALGNGEKVPLTNVTVEGPYDPDSFEPDMLPQSLYKDMALYKKAQAQLKSDLAFPVFLWIAKVQPTK